MDSRLLKAEASRRSSACTKYNTRRASTPRSDRSSTASLHMKEVMSSQYPVSNQVRHRLSEPQAERTTSGSLLASSQRNNKGEMQTWPHERQFRVFALAAFRFKEDGLDEARLSAVHTPRLRAGDDDDVSYPRVSIRRVRSISKPIAVNC